MRTSKLLMALAASSLMAAPAIAGPASSLSVAKAYSAKTSTSAKKSNDLVGLFGGSLLLAGVVAAAVVVGAIVVVADDDDDSDSN
jgi:hypothetical protein